MSVWARVENFGVSRRLIGCLNALILPLKCLVGRPGRVDVEPGPGVRPV